MLTTLRMEEDLYFLPFLELESDQHKHLAKLFVKVSTLGHILDFVYCCRNHQKSWKKLSIFDFFSTIFYDILNNRIEVASILF